MKSERLFKAVGGAEEALLERSERTGGAARRRRAWAAAACVLAAVSLLLLSQRERLFPGDAPPEGGKTVEQLTFPEADGRAFHMLQIQYGPEVPPKSVCDFVIFVNEETYQVTEQDGAYVIAPILTQPGGLPPCRLTITRREGLSPGEALAQEAGELRKAYAQVTEQDGALFASDGTNWDSAQADVTFVDDGQGGTYVLTAAYFLEAAEGHGIRFRDMAGTFQVIDPAEAEAPAWLSDLKAAVAELAPAVFAGRPDRAAARLSRGAQVGAYGEDVLNSVSVMAVDYTVDDPQDPRSAVVSIKHRLGGEDSASFLVLELAYTDGAWLAHWGGLEK